MIDSPSNPTIKAIRALHTTKGRREQKQFLAEGVRVIEDGVKAGLCPQVCLYNFDLLGRTERGRALLANLLAQHRRIGNSPLPTEASQRALAAASDTQQPQGIVAVFSFVEPPAVGAPGETVPLALICDDIQDPGNLGTLLRTAEAAGVTSVWLTPRCADVYSPKVVRAGMGVHFRLPIYTESGWDKIQQDLATLGVEPQQVFATEADASRAYDEVDWRVPSALIVSNEAHGLSDEARQMSRSAGTISIPMAGGTESLNAGIAGAVVLFEAARQRRAQAKVRA
jgi:TrmH family RNA methyltransferase